MIVDANAFSDGHRHECDLCIIGAGAAGIALARELDHRNISIALLESGGFEADASVQSLYDGRAAFPDGALSTDYMPGVRLRYFGGTTNHWAGVCRPLDSWDFERRPWVAESGWPLTRAALDPYYTRAAGLVEIGDFGGEAAEVRDTLDSFAGTARHGLRNRAIQLSPPTRFGTRYRKDLVDSSKVSLLLESNATGFALTPDGRRLAELEITTNGGKRYRVQARRFVLAAGAIESARLLLNSPIAKLSNLIGRNFMEHVLSPVGTLVLKNVPTGSAFKGPLASRLVRPGTVFTFTKAVQSSRRLLNMRLHFEPPAPLDGDELKAMAALMGIAPEKLTTYGVGCLLENAPRPESLVELTDERDRLGLRRARVTWKSGELEATTYRKTLELFGSAIAAGGHGRLKITTDFALARGRWAAHPAGTTRMHADPKRGVVDADCKVHGLENLHVAGAAVFPTCGANNPTLTLLALCLRLADNLKRALA